MDDAAWRTFDVLAWRRLPRALQERAVWYLREWMPPDMLETIRTLANATPQWFVDYHFGMGMAVRNTLREVIPDLDLPPNERGETNWDDYYVPCLEMAARGGMWADVAETERV